MCFFHYLFRFTDGIPFKQPTNKNDRRLQLLPRSLCKAIGFILTTYEPEDDDSETPKNGWMGLDIPGSSRYVKKSAFYGRFFLVKRAQI